MAKWSRKNKEEYNKTRREWYQKNRETERARLKVSNKRRDAELREWFQKLKSTLKCEECGEKHIACLDFHHKDPQQKDLAVSMCINNGWSRDKILKEIEKCIVICSNCHRKLHYNKNISP